MEKQVRILDTTLRDGSYAINFRFSARDTAEIAAALEKTGIDLIEIGHGVGLHASLSGHGVAQETDEAYLAAAANALKTASFGMFCIPGIGRIEDIDIAADHGMGFIRVGTDIPRMRDSAPYIERAKSRGMLVCANFMKSYTASPADFARCAQTTQSFGTDVLYIVDSAGGMLPNELTEYFTAVRDACDIPLAFHGHNNLGMAVALTLKAVELGATMVDTSLQGIGRSSGNAPTEMVVAALDRMGFDTGVDLLPLMDIGEEKIRPLLRKRGFRSLDVVAGQALFHSSYMGKIRQYSEEYRIDPRELIVRLCEIDRINAPSDLVRRVAGEIRSESTGEFSPGYHFDEYFGHEQDSLEE